VGAPPSRRSTISSRGSFPRPLSLVEQLSRPQAGPLPSKRGEIGFDESVHAVLPSVRSDNASSAVLPTVHPADRDAQQARNDATAPSNGDASTPSAQSQSGNAPPSNDSSSTLAPKPQIRRWYQWKNVPTYGGLRLTTLLRFGTQFLLFAGTIVGWALVVTHLTKSQGSSSDSSNNGDSSDSSGNSGISAILGPGMVNLFIYVVFGIAVLVQLLLLERVIFRLRAERYVFLHPGEMMPRRGRSGGPLAFTSPSAPSMGFAPWNRPPLPTYAAALAQSGVGTGDVEDNLIAIPPPPEYGNTRGSTLILANFLARSNSSRSARSQQLRSDADAAERGERRGSQMSQMSGRPLSYVSRDEEWEQRRDDAHRARVLEEALSRLGDGGR